MRLTAFEVNAINLRAGIALAYGEYLGREE